MLDVLLPFQLDDVERLAPLTGRLIGNEMGTGKSYEGIALDYLGRTQLGVTAPTLVIATLSILDMWKDKFEELVPGIRVAVVDPKDRDKLLMEDADVYIVHWHVVRLMIEDLKSIHWGHIIADEAHRMQNRNTTWTVALKTLKAEYKTAMSGTLITSKPDKLWSVMNWLYPKGPDSLAVGAPYYSSYWRFAGKFVDISISPQGYRVFGEPKNVLMLRQMIEPYYVRHLKKEQCCDHHPNGVMSYLKEKYYTEIPVELLPKQRTAYDGMKKNMLAWIGENQDKPVSVPIVAAQFVRLQQFACAYANMDNMSNVLLDEPSSKLDACMQYITDNPDEQFVVFSQFAQLVRLLNERLRSAKVSFVSITGDIPMSHRSGLVRKFQASEKRIFTGTIAAGGEGITLTASSTCIFLDRSWNPAMNKQAEDRLHRHGQPNAVQIIDIRAKNTIDQLKEQRLMQKWDWIKQVLG